MRHLYYRSTLQCTYGALDLCIRLRQ